MLKYLVPTFVSLSLLAPFACGQSKAADYVAEVQKNAAEREALNNPASDDFRDRLQHAAMAHVIAERRAQLQRDTEKLAALTAELKESVAKSNPDLLSMDVVKKAAEIQKLAKSVEDKMKNAY